MKEFDGTEFQDLKGFRMSLRWKVLKSLLFFVPQVLNAKLPKSPTFQQKVFWAKTSYPIPDWTRDIYEQLNNGGKCGDSVDGSGMPVCAYFQLNAKFPSNIKVCLVTNFQLGPSAYFCPKFQTFWVLLVLDVDHRISGLKGILYGH